MNTWKQTYCKRFEYRGQKVVVGAWVEGEVIKLMIASEKDLSAAVRNKEELDECVEGLVGAWKLRVDTRLKGLELHKVLQEAGFENAEEDVP